jgi:hypothetical protein
MGRRNDAAKWYRCVGRAYRSREIMHAKSRLLVPTEHSPYYLPTDNDVFSMIRVGLYM